MKITIHRALAELKVIASRIEKALSELKPLGLYIQGGKINTLYTEEEFTKIAKASAQSVEGLLDYRTKLKRAIVLSNSSTKITVGGKEMSVADAITEKSFLIEKKKYIDALKSHLKYATGKINTENEKVELNLKTVITATFGTDTSNISPEKITAQQVEFRKTNQVNLLDPLKIETKIKELEEQVVAFETEIDAVLSESNAITFIEVD
jgi:hypothetical protein